jgi:hypothetical protein
MVYVWKDHSDCAFAFRAQVTKFKTKKDLEIFEGWREVGFGNCPKGFPIKIFKKEFLTEQKFYDWAKTVPVPIYETRYWGNKEKTEKLN